MMVKQLLSPKFFEQSDLRVGKLSDTIQFCQHEQQTMLVDVDILDGANQVLLFIRGQLVTVYNMGITVDRLDSSIWLNDLPGIDCIVTMRMLSLTPQDVRIFKILIEQISDTRCIIGPGQLLEQHLEGWMGNPLPGLVRVQWPKADGILLLPGTGLGPEYSLLLTKNQIVHSAGGMKEIYERNDKYDLVSYYVSEPRTHAWTEFLLHQAFSNLVISLLGKIEKILGRTMLNQIIRDVNFKATAHDWNLSINTYNVNDQTIFSSPDATAEVYSRLLGVVFEHLEVVLGEMMFVLLVHDALSKLSTVARQVVKEYLPITNVTKK